MEGVGCGVGGSCFKKGVIGVTRKSANKLL